MNSDMNENMGVETVDTSSDEFDSILSQVNFDRKGVDVKRERLMRLQSQVSDLQLDIRTAEREAASVKKQATKLVRSLMESGLEDKAIVTVLKLQFEAKTRREEATPRQNHRLEDDVKDRVLSFLQANPNGVSVNEVWSAFEGHDKVGVTHVVRKLVKDGVVRSVGNTRKCKYFVV